MNKYLPILYVEDTEGIVAINDEGELLAAVVYDNYTRQSVQCHHLIRSPMVLRHGWLDLIHHYAFVRLGVKSLYGLVPGNNDKAIRMNKRMGFTEKCRMEEAFSPGVDYVVMELKAENRRYGKEDPRG